MKPQARLAALVQRLAGLYEVSDRASRLIPMEGVRGIAVLLVFFVHFHGVFSRYVDRGSYLFALSRFSDIVGHAGVDLFFVLSGYLIYGALIRREVSYFSFIQRRVERIYPVFLCVFAIYLALSFLFPAESKIQGPFFPAAIYVLQNALLLPGMTEIRPIITVAWSLSYEFFFYLTLPLLVSFARMRGWKRAARAAFFSVFGLTYLVGSFFVPASRVRLLMFIAGILLYEAISSGAWRRALSKQGEAAALVAFLGSLALAYLLEAHRDLLAFLPRLDAGGSPLPGVPIYQGPYRVLFLSVSCFLFTLYCFQFDGFVKKACSWAPLRYLGNMSYSYYLIHGVTLKGLALGVSLVFAPSGHAPFLFCMFLFLSLCATWVTSTLLFVLVERPFSLEGRTGLDPTLVAVSWFRAATGRRLSVRAGGLE